MEAKKILVSGGTGFIGRAVVQSLQQKGCGVKILSHRPENKEAIYGNITKPETLSKVCNGIDIVIQCAQFPGHPIENKRKHYTYFEVDALGTENLAKAAKKSGVKYFIYLSGAGTDGKKQEPWFKAKWYAEQAIHGTGVPCTILRPSWVYGPEDRSLNPIIWALKKFPVFPMIGSGNNHVQPIFIDDLAAVVALCAETATDQDRLFEVGGPQELTMKEMLKAVAQSLDKKILFVPIPKWPFKLVGFKAVDFITMDVRIDIKPLQKAFPGLSLRPLAEGLKKYIS